ncbi:MAG: SHOCT domain-containing protein [Candidatus Liptonbacteria bacterium]|nr:SHOCT domain-containing protein [Candidatus Liptonbacteria bacterium]
MMTFGYQGIGALGVVFVFFWWVVVVAVIALLVRWILKVIKGKNGASALDILKERYAKGEIDKKEYEEKKRDLG